MKPKINKDRNCINCISGPSLVILAWTDDKLLCRQAQNEVKFEFQVQFDLEGQGRSTPKTLGILTILGCISGTNLVFLAWTGDKLLYGHSQNEVKFEFQVKFDLEGQCRSNPQIIGTSNKAFCTFTPNNYSLNEWWVIVQTRPWLIRTWTHGHTDRQTQATTVPKGQNWPRVKMEIEKFSELSPCILSRLSRAFILSPLPHVTENGMLM